MASEVSVSKPHTRLLLLEFSYTQTIVRRKNAMKVKVAIARKILVAIWHMLSEGVSYRDYKKPDVQTDGNS